MDHSDVLKDAAQRPADTAAVVLNDISTQTLNATPGGSGNSIAWLIWHAARQMDVQTVAMSGAESVWESGDWARRLGVDRGADDFGFGDSADRVASLRVEDATALREHLQACVDALVAYTDGMTAADLDDVVDDSYDPPTTRGVRIVSIIDDAVVHLGQAAYARGLVEGWSLGV